MLTGKPDVAPRSRGARPDGDRSLPAGHVRGLALLVVVAGLFMAEPVRAQGAACSCGTAPSFERYILTSMLGETTALAVMQLNEEPAMFRKLSRMFGRTRAGLHRALRISLMGKLEQANTQLAKVMDDLDKLDSALTAAQAAGVLSLTGADQLRGLHTQLVQGVGDLAFNPGVLACGDAGPSCGFGQCPAGSTCVLDKDLGLGCVCYGFAVVPPVD